MTSVLNSFFDGIAESQLYLNSINPLAAFWSTPRYIIEDGKLKREIRFCKGQQIKLYEGRAWINCETDNDATHEIVAVNGAINHSFSFKLKSLDTGEEYTLNL